MKDIDELIGRALTEEDRALLASHAEPGYFAQAFGLFRGPSAWVMWITYFVTLAALVGGVSALWRMWGAADALDAVRWGVLGLLLFQMIVVTKGYLGQRLEANRLQREIKRVELQVALLRERG